MFLACSRAGIACNPSLHRTYTSGEVVQLLDRLQSRIVLTRHGWGADGRAGQSRRSNSTRLINPVRASWLA